MALGRRHNVLGTFEAGQLGMRFVEQQILDKRLHPNVDPAQPGADSFLEGLAAAEMDDVNRGARHLGKRHKMVHTSLSLHARRAAFMVALWTGDPLGEKLLLRFGDEHFVFAVRCGDDSKSLCPPEGLILFAIVDSESAFVGQKDFERLDLNDWTPSATTLSSCAAELSSNRVTPM